MLRAANLSYPARLQDARCTLPGSEDLRPTPYAANPVSNRMLARLQFTGLRLAHVCERSGAWRCDEMMRSGIWRRWRAGGSNRRDLTLDLGSGLRALASRGPRSSVDTRPLDSPASTPATPDPIVPLQRQNARSHSVLCALQCSNLFSFGFAGLGLVGESNGRDSTSGLGSARSSRVLTPPRRNGEWLYSDR